MTNPRALQNAEEIPTTTMAADGAAPAPEDAPAASHDVSGHSKKLLSPEEGTPTMSTDGAAFAARIDDDFSSAASSFDDAAPVQSKQRLRMNRRPENLLLRSPRESCWGRILYHPVFETCALLLILMNAMWIGFDVDQRDPDGGDPPASFTLVEYMFCVLFSFELCVRFMAYKRRRTFFTDPAQWHWNVFDSVLVAMVVIENTVIPLLFKGSEGLRSLSSMRLLRLLRITRVLRMVPELAMMVKSMLAAIRSVSMTFLLATGIMYVFSIVLTQWAQNHIQKMECDGFTCVEEAFGTIAKSLLSLTQILVFDDTFTMIRAILEESMFYGCLLLFFIVIASFTVLNMLIGVICQIVSSTTAMESEKGRRIQVEDLFEQIDIDGSGSLTRSEFHKFNAPELLEKLGIDETVLKHAFDIMDVDGNTCLQMSEFIEMIFKLLHPPEAQDVLVIHRKLERLASALGVGITNGSRRTSPNSPPDSDREDSQSRLRVAILPSECDLIDRKIDELESQITSLVHGTSVEEERGASLRASVSGTEYDQSCFGDALPGSESQGAFQKELLGLDAVLGRLRERLQLCLPQVTDEKEKSDGVETGNFVHWKRICGEVVQTLGVSTSMVSQLLVCHDLEDIAVGRCGIELQSPLNGGVRGLDSSRFGTPIADRCQTR